MAVQFASESGIKNSTRHKGMLGNLPVPPVLVSYAIVAGGGFNGSSATVCNVSNVPGGGGGAGGFRKSFETELSGGGAPSESPLAAPLAQNITVTVGGAGSNSSVGTLISTRGGNGGNPRVAGGSGGSGGGGGGSGDCGGGPGAGGAGTAGQGFAGTSGGQGGTIYGTPFAGGGGAGGGAAPNGAGLATLITGSTQTFSRNTASAANTGNLASSGIVILRYPSSRIMTIGPGLTASTITVGSDKVTTFTAGTGNISWTY